MGGRSGSGLSQEREEEPTVSFPLFEPRNFKQATILAFGMAQNVTPNSLAAGKQPSLSYKKTAQPRKRFHFSPFLTIQTGPFESAARAGFPFRTVSFAC
jgi:hypothetical protein